MAKVLCKGQNCVIRMKEQKIENYVRPWPQSTSGPPQPPRSCLDFAEQKMAAAATARPRCGSRCGSLATQKSTMAALYIVWCDFVVLESIHIGLDVHFWTYQSRQLFICFSFLQIDFYHSTLLIWKGFCFNLIQFRHN